MAKISSVKAREILDSRGNPTVEVCYICMCFIVCDTRESSYVRVHYFAHKICFNLKLSVFLLLLTIATHIQTQKSMYNTMNYYRLNYAQKMVSS